MRKYTMGDFGGVNVTPVDFVTTGTSGMGITIDWGDIGEKIEEEGQKLISNALNLPKPNSQTNATAPQVIPSQQSFFQKNAVMIGISVITISTLAGLYFLYRRNK